MYRWLSVYEGSQLIAENISASADTVPIIGHDLCYPVCKEARNWKYMEIAPWAGEFPPLEQVHIDKSGLSV